jgi:pyruvate formate lyase activating enzyme
LVAAELTCDVPLHFTAFHPDWKLRDVPATPPATLTRARAIARAAGLRHVYTGNVRDIDGGTTLCQQCGARVVVRDGYRISAYALDEDGCCRRCGNALPGHYDRRAGRFGERRVPVRIATV